VNKSSGSFYYGTTDSIVALYEYLSLLFGKDGYGVKTADKDYSTILQAQQR
jgi:hypothetical protein